MADDIVEYHLSDSCFTAATVENFWLKQQNIPYVMWFQSFSLYDSPLFDYINPGIRWKCEADSEKEKEINEKKEERGEKLRKQQGLSQEKGDRFCDKIVYVPVPLCPNTAYCLFFIKSLVPTSKSWTANIQSVITDTGFKADHLLEL